MIDLLDDPDSLSTIHLCTDCIISQGLGDSVILKDFPEKLEPLCSKCFAEQNQAG